jgi:hypothetical protein
LTKGARILNVSLHSHHYIYMGALVAMRRKPLVAMTGRRVLSLPIQSSFFISYPKFIL